MREQRGHEERVQSSPVYQREADWLDPFQPTAEREDEFSALVQDLRAVQEAVTCSRPSPSAAREAARLLRETRTLLGAFETTEDDQIAGRHWDLPGRAQALIPPLHVDQVTTTTAKGRFTVGRFHSGRYAMNGGVAPLVFDEIMGRLASSGDRPFARTARLTVNFRAPAPLGVELRIEAELIGQEGRKRFVRGVMLHGAMVVAEADGLWVETPPDKRSAV
jgi:hypothetical protein